MMTLEKSKRQVTLSFLNHGKNLGFLWEKKGGTLEGVVGTALNRFPSEIIRLLLCRGEK